MGEIENLGILDEIQSITCDKLQVVSYKWLSRNFLVSSNAAKRLLQEFVDKYGNGLEVIYSLSGWLKTNPSTYHVRLVSKNNLSDAKQKFDGNCSIQVYSVQACLPKDSATLWNQEFVQAEDLFKQPLTVDNCLRDNRFCGVSNPYVERIVGEKPVGSETQQVKSAGVAGLSKSSTHPATTVSQPQQKKVQHSSPNMGVQSLHIDKNVKMNVHVKLEQEKGAQNREKASHLPANNKKNQTDKNSSGTGSALASMWGRASAKPKPDTMSAQTNSSKQNSAASAEAQISAQESVECEDSDEDAQDFNVKRASNGEGSRKRRVVLDYSDEEDEYQNAVNLASPEPPKKSSLCSKDSSKISCLESNLSFEENEDKPKILSFEENKDEPKINKVEEADEKPKQQLGERVSSISKGKEAESPTLEKVPGHVSKVEASMKDKATDAVLKRRKVLKTRIDERGREVTEVVWEGEELETKSDTNSTKTAENNTVNNPINRPPVARKSPAVGNSAPVNPPGKAGNKKGGNKDPKQGNILSFFKKV